MQHIYVLLCSSFRDFYITSNVSVDFTPYTTMKPSDNFLLLSVNKSPIILDTSMDALGLSC